MLENFRNKSIFVLELEIKMRQPGKWLKLGKFYGYPWLFLFYIHFFLFAFVLFAYNSRLPIKHNQYGKQTL